MKALLEGSLFLTAAAGLHLLAFSALQSPTGAAGAAGDAGKALVTLAAAPARLAALVEQWEAPPATAPTPDAPQMPQPEAAAQPVQLPQPLVQLTAPGPSLPPPDSAAAPVLDTASATPQPKPAPKPEPKPERKPQPKPQPKPKPAKPSAPSSAQKAAGSGNTGAAGKAKSTAPSLSAAQTRSLAADWAAQILSRIERRKAYPSTAGGRDGAVGLRLSVSSDGKLQSVSVTKSAGHPALDRAAVQAVKRAGRFPPAPQALQGRSFAFNLTIRFDG